MCNIKKPQRAMIVEMGRFRLAIKTDFGEISIEADSPADLRSALASIGVAEQTTNSLLESVKGKLQTPALPSPVLVAPPKPEATGIIEYGSDGTPHITVPPEKLSAREVIGLLLYSKSPNAVSLGELTSLVANNWKGVGTPYVSSILNQMRAFVIKEGSRGSYSYKLSGSGKSWTQNELLPKLKPGNP